MSVHSYIGPSKKLSYLNLCIRLGGSYVIPTINKEADKFPRARTAQLRRVVLLLNQARLRVNEKTCRSNFLAPIYRVAPAVKQNE